MGVVGVMEGKAEVMGEAVETQVVVTIVGMNTEVEIPSLGESR